MNREELERLGAIVIAAAIQVHRDAGPGLLESVYKILLARELTIRGCFVEMEKVISLTINGVEFEKGFVADIVVDNAIIIEIKSVEKLHPIHFKQLLTYLRLTGLKLGYLLNFREELMKSGIHRVANRL